MQNILVTGGCGFIGSNFLNYITVKYPEIKFVNIDRLDYCATLNNVKEISNRDNYFFECFDIQDNQKVLDVLNKYNIDGVFHMAAQTHVDKSFCNSLEFTKSNTLGTHSLLEACRIYGFDKITRFIHVSTDEVYGESLDDKNKTILSILNPTNPYAATKAAAEQLIHAYEKSFGLRAIITRSNNVYGPQQYPDKLISLGAFNFINGKKFQVHGTGLSKRSFIYIDDIVKAFELVLFKGSPGLIYNIGSCYEYTVNEVINKLINIIHGPQSKMNDYVNYVKDRPFNDYRYLIDDHLIKELGWKENINSFEDGLKKTIEWYRKIFSVENWWSQKKKRYLFWGSRGWIGNQFCQYLYKNDPFIEIIHGKSRLDNIEKVEEEIKENLELGLDSVICFIGRTYGPTNSTIDYLEDKLDLNIRDNLFSPLSLSLLCKKFNLHCTYLGTGCIFKYDQDHPIGGLKFQKDDLPNYFGSAYSIVKGFTDRLMHQFKESVLNVRIRMPISEKENPRDFITKLVNYKRVIDIPNSVSVLPTLFPVLHQLIVNKTTGTINLVNPGTISHVEILQLYKKYIDPEHVIEVFTQEEQRKILKADRSNNELESFVPSLPSALQAVDEILRKRSSILKQ